MAYRPTVASRRAVAAWIAGVVAAYATVFGFGDGRPWVIVLSVALVLLVVAGAVALEYRNRRPARVWVAGTAHVLNTSTPPESLAYGRAELRVIVEAPGVPPATVTVRDPRVPVTKWPDAGATLPVTVAADDPRRVRVRWDDVLTHAEAEAEAAASDEPGPSDYLPHHEPLDEAFDMAFTPLREEELAGLDSDRWRPRPSRTVLLDDEPSGLVARYLFPTERYRGEWRRHVVRPVRWFVAPFLLAVAGTIAVRQEVRPEYVTETLAAICAVGAALSSYAVLAWHVGRLSLTNKRLLLVEGILRRRVSSLALGRVTDLRFEQTPSGRLWNYGDFVIEGARRFSRMRRVADVPNPHELYLRIIEELYEPEAVEARLGSWNPDYDDHDGSADPAGPSDSAGPSGTAGPTAPAGTRVAADTYPVYETSPEVLSQAIREALYGPTLANYDGWVSVEVLDHGRKVPITEDRHVRLEPDRSYEVRVVIADEPTGAVAEPLVVTGGVDREVVEFAAEVDSDQRALRCPSRPITVDSDGGSARFTIRTPDEPFGESPWLWVRVSQQRRLLQSIELTATGPAMLER